MSSINVLFKNLEGAARLSGAEGSAVIDGENGKELRGDFSLVVGGISSRARPFGPHVARAVVRRLGSSWYLDRLARLRFQFDPPLRLDAHSGTSPGNGPVLICDTADVESSENTSMQLVVSMESSTISLLSGAAYDPQSTDFIVPRSAGGEDRIQLMRASIPGVNWIGFFLQRLPDQRVYMVTGGFPGNKTVTIDHHPEVSLLFPPATQLRFPIAANDALSDAGGLQFDLSGSSSSATVKALKTTGVRLPKGAFPPIATSATFQYARTEEGGITASQWTDSTVTVDMVASSGNENLTETSFAQLATPKDRLAFHLPLPSGHHDPQFLYHDDSANRSNPSGSRVDRSHGVWFNAIGTVRGGRTVLDSNWLQIALSASPPDAGNGVAPQPRTFILRAGVPFQAPGKNGDSIVVPKVVRADGPGGAAAWVRELQVPVGTLTARVAAHDIHSGLTSSATPISLDTSRPHQVEFRSCTLLGPPMGRPAAAGSAGNATADEFFSPWMLRRSTGVKFSIDGTSLVPEEGADWIRPFVTVPARYSILEHPGMKVEYLSGDGTGLTESSTGLKTEVVGGTKEQIVYSSMFAAFTFLAVDYNQTAEKRKLDDAHVVYKSAKFDDKTFVKRNASTADFVVANYSDSAGDLGDMKIREFVDANRPTDPAITQFVWPLFMNLAVPLWTRDGGKYCTQIARERASDMKPGLAIDLSATTGFDPTWMGWRTSNDPAGDDWSIFAERSPVLWPRKSGAKGARLDPSVETWTGILLRDMPLVLDIPDKLQGDVHKFETIEKLFNEINSHLVLNYGWKDSSGTTWDASLRINAALDFTPTSWIKPGTDPILRFELLDFRTTGAANSMVTAEGNLKITLGFLKVKDGANEKPLALLGRVVMNLVKGGIDRIEIRPENPLTWETTSIPGFKRVLVNRFSTDLRTAELSIQLFADDRLRHALPFLDSDQPIKGKAVINLGGDKPPAFVLTFELPAENHTNLFGKWAMTIQAVQLAVGSIGSSLLVRGRLNLGAGGLLSVGADIIVSGTGANWDLDVRLNEIGGTLGFGGFKVSGHLAWGKSNERTALPADQLAGPGKSRDLYGSLKLTDNPVLPETQLNLRVGNKGEMTFFVGAIRSKQAIPLGSAKLEEPAIVLAHNADFGDGLKKLLSTVNTQGSLAAIRPSDDSEAWLEKWTPAAGVGTLFAGSGYLNLHPSVASAPPPDGANEKEDKHLTALAITSGGLIRVDACSMMLGKLPVNFSLFVDVPNLKMVAGFQLAKVDYGPYKVSGGYLELGVGLAGNFYFLMSLGWPPLISGSDIERDWYKSVMIHWDGAFPLNTFWGGFRAELDAKTRSMFLGFALRAGWTWSYTINAVVAKGSAELGVAVGGVIGILFRVSDSFADSPRLALPAPPDQSAAHLRLERMAVMDSLASAQPATIDMVRTIDAAARVMEAAMASLTVDAIWSVTLYADVWGKASAELFGVTIAAISVSARARFHICGHVPGIDVCKAVVGLTLTVQILCFKISANAEITLYLKHGDCSIEQFARDAGDRFLIQPAAGLLATN